MDASFPEVPQKSQWGCICTLFASGAAWQLFLTNTVTPVCSTGMYLDPSRNVCEGTAASTPQSASQRAGGGGQPLMLCAGCWGLDGSGQSSYHLVVLGDVKTSPYNFYVTYTYFTVICSVSAKCLLNRLSYTSGPQRQVGFSFSFVTVPTFPF